MNQGLRNAVGCSVMRLCDGYRARAEPLLQRGWSSFQPMLAAPERFDVPADEAAELETFETELKRETVACGAYVSTYFLRMKAAARAMYSESRDVLDLEFPRYAKTLARMRRDQPDRYEQVERSIRADVERQAALEMEFHASRIDEACSGGENVAPVRICRAVAEQELATCGFEVDRSMSVRGVPIVTKPVSEDWKLAVTVDRGDLSRLKHIGWSSRELHVTFALVRESARGKETEKPERRVAFELGCFFPLGLGRQPFGWAYFRVTTNREIALYTLAICDMYGIVMNPFERMLRHGLDAAKVDGLDRT